MAFGAEPRAEQLLELSHKIKTFTEGTDPDSSEILEIRKHMGMANRLIFLGFAFYEQNMRLIKPDLPNENINKPPLKSFATTKGISESDELTIKGLIKELFFPLSIDVNTKSVDCGSFFPYFRISLTF